jgi:formylglycine-generating enzyme required for sulfatase activity
VRVARGDDRTTKPAGEPIEPFAFSPPGLLAGTRWPRLPWARLGIIATLVTAAAVLAFVFGARSVRITMTPPDARVRVASGLAPHVGETWMLLPGHRLVEAWAGGYRPLRERILIGDDATQHFALALRPLPGHLRVTVSPVASAELTIDDQPPRPVPATIDEIEAGTREITVRAPRYLDFTTTLEIEGKGREQALEVSLRPAWAEFTIASQPVGAQVFSDTTALGVTPLSAELLHGEREIIVKKPGYKVWRRKLSVTAGQAISIPDVRLVKDDGYLKVTSSPPGAAVTVDGKFKGETPVQFAVTPDAEHEIAAMKTGYVPGRTTASVGSGAVLELPLQLAPELAVIELITDPADAELLLDGEPHGGATQRLELPTFEHEVIVRKAGYATYRTVVTPRKGVAKRLQIRLKTAAEMAAEDAARNTAAAAPDTSAGAPPAAQTSALAQQQADLVSSVVMPSELAKSTRAVNFAADGMVRSILGQELKLVAGGEFRFSTHNQSVRLARPFYVGVREVSNREYRQFVSSYHTRGVEGQDLDGDNLPVANVTWEAAATYCNWLSRRESLPPFYQIKYGRVLGVNPDSPGYRLPTEAEWEFVARVAPDASLLDFPWMGKFPPRGRSGNYADEAASGLAKVVIKGYNDGFAAAAPVGSFPANLRGFHDLGGNVSEWVHDFHEDGDQPSGVDPLGPTTGTWHTVRGSSWAQGSQEELRVSFRAPGKGPRPDLGFRLARYAQ